MRCKLDEVSYAVLRELLWSFLGRLWFVGEALEEPGDLESPEESHGAVDSCGIEWVRKRSAGAVRRDFAKEQN